MNVEIEEHDRVDAQPYYCASFSRVIVFSGFFV